jgi:deoxyribonuclease IV
MRFVWRSQHGPAARRWCCSNTRQARDERSVIVSNIWRRCSRRVGVCLDTCHLVAAGYDITTEGGYRDTFEQFDRLVGLERLKVFHANDSKRPCGSRVDRHEHIGAGCIGLQPFGRLLADPRFAALAMLIETEKTHGIERRGTIVADPLDVKNLETLRRLRNGKS